MSEHFFIIGAQRSGTTYLYSLLNSHPEIEMARPLRPEPKFFLNNASYESGVEAYERTYFNHKPGAWLLGEKSTSYMESERAAQRIAAVYPGATLIALLRDPIQRAISNYYFSVENGLETLGIEEAFRLEEERIQTTEMTTSVSPFAYLHRGRYIDYLEIYERYFPREQFVLLTTEQFTGSLAAYQSLCARLGVNSGHKPPDLDKRVNQTTLVHEPLSHSLETYLIQYFLAPTTQLSNQYAIDVRDWPSFASQQ